MTGGFDFNSLGAQPFTAPAPDRRPVFYYRAYGMSIRSEISLPELLESEPQDADLVIALSSIERPEEMRSGNTTFSFGPDRQCFHWDSVGTFLITGDYRIDVDPAPGVDERLIAFPLLGPVMATLLASRGFLILHGSACASKGRCAVFLGDKGAGKSTSAGMMVAAGHELLTDDVVAVQFQGGDPVVLPAFPQMKLAADAAAVIRVEGAEVRDEVHPAIPKRQHRLSTGFSKSSVRPGSIYVLERGERAHMTPLGRAEALSALLRFSYMARFGRDGHLARERQLRLRQCARIASESRVCRLEVPTGLDRLGEMVQLVEADLAGRELP